MSTDLVLPGSVSETGLELPADLGYEEWAATGRVLGRIERACQWWIGDWLNYGERAYGEKYAQAMEATGLEYQTLANAAYVASRVELSLRRESLTWSHHKEVASLSPAEQRSWLATAEYDGFTVRDLKQALRTRKAIDPPPLPEGQYRVIYADPPWEYADGFASFPGEDTSTQRRQEKPLPYSSMSVEEIAALPVDDLLADDAALFLWTTNRYLPDAFWVLGAWGFDYRQTLVWHKTGNPSPFGGVATPLHAEFLLVATRGDCTLARVDYTGSVIAADKPYKHSEKPAVFRDLIESLLGGPRLEMFGRKKHDGWDVWGVDVPRAVAA